MAAKHLNYHLWSFVQRAHEKQGFKTTVPGQYTRQEEFKDCRIEWLLLLAVVSLLKENKFKYPKVSS